jgi:formamidopyrimidine-DNA glycosylase
MPELPEVEFARRQLRRWLHRATVIDAKAHAKQIARSDALATIVGRKVKAIERKGKWIRVTFDGGARLFSHFGLTGKWVLRDRDAETERYERARIDTSKSSLRYLDPRMFGRIEVSERDVPGWTKLGPDPLVDGIDVPRLQKIFGRRKRTVKETLLDQKVLAGIGNIQAIESLWRAKIDPRTRADALSAADVRTLAKAIRWSIDRTLELEAGDEITYVEESRAANPFIVYGKRGKPCPRCKTSIERIVIGGRGTYLCPTCQRRR